MKLHTTLAANLQMCLNDRKRKLLENPLSMCATFLDPRYKCEIDRDHEKLRFVEKTLEHLWDKMRCEKMARLKIMNQQTHLMT